MNDNKNEKVLLQESLIYLTDIVDKLHTKIEIIELEIKSIYVNIEKINLKFKKDNGYSVNNNTSHTYGSNNMENSFINNNKDIHDNKEINNNNNNIYLNNQKSLEEDRLKILRARRRNL